MLFLFLFFRISSFVCFWCFCLLLFVLVCFVCLCWSVFVIFCVFSLCFVGFVFVLLMGVLECSRCCSCLVMFGLFCLC